jgi:hypothetical protein
MKSFPGVILAKIVPESTASHPFRPIFAGIRKLRLTGDEPLLRPETSGEVFRGSKAFRRENMAWNKRNGGPWTVHDLLRFAGT